MSDTLALPEPPLAPKPRVTAQDRADRRDRIFARLLEGQSPAAIAQDEGVTARRVRQVVQETLNRWDSDPIEDYAAVQIARLEAALRLIEERMAAGEVNAVDRLIKVLEQLDKYHEAQLRFSKPLIKDEQEEAAFAGRLERMAASRAAVATRIAAARAAAQAGARKENGAQRVENA